MKARHCFLILCVVWLLPCGVDAAGAPKAVPPAATSDASESDSRPPKTEKMPPSANAGDASKSAAMPVYKPPRRSAPAGRVGGGSRGPGEKLPLIQVLAPDHVGLTTRDQPTLYWYLSDLPAHPVELTIIAKEAIDPLCERRIQAPENTGIQKIRMADLGDLRLKEGVRYQWFVSIIPDPDYRSKDAISGAEVEFIKPTSAQKLKLENVDKPSLPYLYAEEGFWYDAFDAVIDLIDSNPDYQHFKQMRASLIEQVGLELGKGE